MKSMKGWVIFSRPFSKPSLTAKPNTTAANPTIHVTNLNKDSFCSAPLCSKNFQRSVLAVLGDPKSGVPFLPMLHLHLFKQGRLRYITLPTSDRGNAADKPSSDE